ncbi:MAG: hypothetical protein QNJ47_21970 [Nostocaceae cyanobacterium]|nr:hypothetical protein [Nostocaceae cyanobacterium]
MSNNPLLDSGSSSSKTPGLKPPLAAALASLEVQLDQELARYRRTRIGSRIPNQPRLYSSITNQSQDVNDMGAIDSNTQLSTIAPVLANRLATPGSSASKSPEVSVSKVETEAELTGQQTAKTEAIDTTDVNSSKIVPAVPKNGNLDKSSNVNENGKPPDDYLESSEALLRSLTEDQSTASAPKQSKNNDFLLSPVGIGLMLLLIVGSLALGYGFSNPKNLPQFNLAKLFKPSSPIGENTQTIGSNTKTVSQPEITPLAKYPNLATQEFPEVKDLNDVVGLTPKAKLTPTAKPKPAAIPNTSRTTTIVPPPTAPKPPKPTTPKPTTEIKPSADGFYRVVAENQNDQMLAKAKQIVPDAYLSKDKKYIYLGAIKNKDKAQQLVKQLQAKGIQARIGKP